MLHILIPTFSRMMDSEQDLKVQIVGTNKGQLHKFFSLKITLRAMKQKKSYYYYFFFFYKEVFFLLSLQNHDHLFI